jgi:hypothetical protein
MTPRVSFTFRDRQPAPRVRDYEPGRTARSSIPGAALLLILVAAACGSSGSAGQDPPFTAVATIDEVMDAIVIPASTAIFDAVIYSNGALVQAPMTDDDWHAIRMQALASAEAGNLLMMTPRAKDHGDWIARCREFMNASTAAARAAKDKDVGRLLQAGGDLYTTCVACHRQYVPDDNGS